jgi:hypothetical protein
MNLVTQSAVQAVSAAQGGDAMKKFTEDEKVIARNIDKKYKWIGRNSAGSLYACKRWGENRDGTFVMEGAGDFLYSFNHLFKQIRNKQKPMLIRDIYDPQILDDKERQYLTVVLKPLPSVEEIYKNKSLIENREYLMVKFYNGETMSFPYFKPHAMYKGMKCDKAYTLEELGLFEGDAE